MPLWLRTGLGLARFLVLALIVATLLEPTAVVTESHTRARSLPVLLNISESMSMKDQRKSAADLIDAGAALGMVPLDHQADADSLVMGLDSNQRQAISNASRFDLAAAALSESARPVFESLAVDLDLSYHAFGQGSRLISDDGSYSTAGTSLGLMAFMVKGHFPGFGRHGPALDRAKEFLLKKAEESSTGMYEHGLYTLALSELWGMTNNVEDNKRVQVALERAVQVILRAQSPLGGWRYHARPDCGQDTSVTAMVFVSLASARQAGILVPTETIDRVVGYLGDQVWNESTGGFGYQGSGGSTLACTAGGAYAAQLCGMRDTEWVQASIRYLENSPKVFNRKEIGYYYYAHYYASQAMVQAGEEHYAKWYPQIRDSLIALQQPDGSWDETKKYPHPTPMAIIILGIPHRYIPVYQE